MKKIATIVNLSPVNEIYDLLTDFKLQRKNLKRYLSSLKLFKQQIQANAEVITKMSSEYSNMKISQSKPRKKTSKIEYFMLNGINVYGSVCGVHEKLAFFYTNLLKQANLTEGRMNKCLIEQKPRMERGKQSFERELKSYSAYCYPETNSIIFKLGLANIEKLTKKEDSFREKVIIQEANTFVQLLKNCLYEIQVLKESVMNLSHTYYEGARDFCISQFQFGIEALKKMETNQEEVDKLGIETEGNQTDRSFRSMPDEQKNEEP